MNTVISKDGTTIAYDKLGSGQPIILIDGALCYRSFGPMAKLAPLLAKHFTVYWYDRRGRGDSTDKKPYSVEREVEDLEALINNAGGSVYVAGLSSGAALGLRAVKSGLNISKLVMYEPPYVLGKKSNQTPPDHVGQLNALIASNRRSAAVKYFMVDMVGAPAIAAFIMRLLPMWKKFTTIAHTLPYDAAIMGDWSVPTEIVSAVTIPTLIAGGEKSPATLRNAVQLISESLPNGTLRVLEGQSHNVNTEILASMLTEFFTNHH